MNNILIITKPDDIHAISVKLALNKNGYTADLWYTSDFPLKTTHSFEIKKNKFTWLSDEKSLSDNDYQVIWYRRPAKPIMPDHIHSDDISNARKEALVFHHSMLHTVFSTATWINPVTSSQKANSKLLQLKIADQVQLNIPETLISNDPKSIKNFIIKKPCIYKTLYPTTWINKNEIRLTYTNNITIENLPSDKILQCTPSIFQRKIEKKHEIRVTYFGKNYIAVKIDSQKHNETKLDWRCAPVNKLSLEQVSLPIQIDNACQKLMEKLGIVFGCFDFIVTPDNEYYFLEVNEQGQFLWIEANNPDIKMLQSFIGFITQKNIPVSLHEVKDESNNLMNLALKNHTLT